ncbi:hypothetical protein CAPTEDRAFT_210072 [Capitella teleta]|uniref:CCHC-type domain-containing protein n=1 Tax=Capitella teleta TaxID=283909 RepID=R7V160_CAPTE|nr:hypothetical protein CAPTEDRAFT_210072 [Capitella teleta]|eukprot:ELU12583.1 hypothetical protein CAPTEDRAFT_210072 [Capitella teleta]
MPKKSQLAAFTGEETAAKKYPGLSGIVMHGRHTGTHDEQHHHTFLVENNGTAGFNRAESALMNPVVSAGTQWCAGDVLTRDESPPPSQTPPPPTGKATAAAQTKNTDKTKRKKEKSIKIKTKSLLPKPKSTCISGKVQEKKLVCSSQLPKAKRAPLNRFTILDPDAKDAYHEDMFVDVTNSLKRGNGPSIQRDPTIADASATERYIKRVGFCDGDKPSRTLEWLRAIDRLPEDIQVQIALHTVESTIHSSLRELKNAKWHKIKKLLANRFANANFSEAQKEALDRLEQRPGEGLYNYITTFEILLNEAYQSLPLDQTSLIRTFLSGLCDREMVRSVARKKLRTLPEIVKEVRRHYQDDDLLRPRRISKVHSIEKYEDPQVAALSMVVNDLVSLQKETCAQIAALAKVEPKPPKNPKNYSCYRCGKQGHFARECRTKDTNSLPVQTMQQNASGIRCSKCRRVGHTTKNCRIGSPKYPCYCGDIPDVWVTDRIDLRDLARHQKEQFHDAYVEASQETDESPYIVQGSLLYTIAEPSHNAGRYLRLLLPQQFRQKVIDRCHAEVGHAAFLKTLSRVQEHYVWPDVALVVSDHLRVSSAVSVYKCRSGVATQYTTANPSLCSRPARSCVTRLYNHTPEGLLLSTVTFGTSDLDLIIRERWRIGRIVSQSILRGLALPCEALIDTGAARSLLSATCWQRIARPDCRKQPTQVILQTVSGTPLQTSGEVTLEIEDIGMCFFIICPELSLDVILGSDLLRRAGCTIHYEDRCMTTRHRCVYPCEWEPSTPFLISLRSLSTPTDTPLYLHSLLRHPVFRDKIGHCMVGQPATIVTTRDMIRYR